MLIATAVVLVCLGIAGQLVFFGLKRDNAHGFIPMFHLNGEGNFPAVFSSGLLFLAGLVALMIGIASRRRRDRWWKHWLAVAAALGLACLDEFMDLHNWYGLEFARLVEGSGFFRFVWVVPGLAIAAVLVVFFSRFVFALEPKTRTRVIVGACLYLGGALGLEMIGAKLFEVYGGMDNIPFQIEVTIEESLEMAGTLVCLNAFATYLTEHVGIRTINVSLSSR